MSKFALEIPNLPKHLEHYITINVQQPTFTPVYKKIIKCLALYFSEVGVDFRKPEEVLKVNIPARHYPGKQLSLHHGGSLVLSQKNTNELVDVLEAMFLEEFYNYVDIRLEVQLDVNAKTNRIIASEKLSRNVTQKALLSLKTNNIIKPAIEEFMRKYELVGTKKNFENLKKTYYRYSERRKATSNKG